MDTPITLIDDQFIKLSFDFFLCIKQLAWIFGLSTVFVAIYRTFKPQEDDDEPSSNIPQAPMNDQQIHYMNTMEERRRQRELDKQKEAEEEERKAEARANERHQKIERALFQRTSQTKSKTCSQCGGAYGTGIKCQFCGA